jgi:hypothetical protein
MGMLLDASGTPYTPTHASKSGRRYRYYTSQAVIKKTEKGNAPGRIPAPDLEKAVIDRILNWLQTPADLLAALQDESSESPPKGFLARILRHAAKTAETWRSRIAIDRTQFLKTVIERVVVHSDHIETRLRVPALINEILGTTSVPATLPESTSIECPFRHVSLGRPLRMIIAGASITTEASRQAILKAIARARAWYEQLTSGEASSIAKLAAKYRVTPRFIRMYMKLVQLSPLSIEKLMTRPESLPLSLAELLTNVPMNWNEQVFGVPPLLQSQKDPRRSMT